MTETRPWPILATTNKSIMLAAIARAEAQLAGERTLHGATDREYY